MRFPPRANVAVCWRVLAKIGVIALPLPTLRRPASVIFKRTISAFRPPATIRSGVAVARPAMPVDGSCIVLGDGRLTAREVQSLKFNNFPVVVLRLSRVIKITLRQAGGSW